ncbi:MAG: MurR/RpiR family transcriptional regulator [Burkholderiales bacterium]
MAKTSRRQSSEAAKAAGPGDGQPIGFTPKVITLLREALNDLTRSQKVLGLYLLQHPEKIGYLSIRELAQSAGVSLATVFRLCRHLGYKGYDELGAEVQRSVQYELSTPTRFRLGADAPSAKGRLSAFERVISAELDSLTTMTRTIQVDDVSRCVQWMNQADHLIVIGTMGSTSLAEYFAYAASKVLRSVRLVTSVGGSATWYQFKDISAATLVLLLGFPRYQQSTLEFGNYFKRRGCRIVAITDHYRSPLAAPADIVFPIAISFSTIVDSFTAPVAFIHGLVAEYSERYGDQIRDHLADFEDYTADMQIWTKSPRRG